MNVLFKLQLRMEGCPITLHVMKNDTPDSLALRLCLQKGLDSSSAHSVKAKLVHSLYSLIKNQRLSELLKAEVSQFLTQSNTFISPIRFIESHKKVKEEEVQPFQEEQRNSPQTKKRPASSYLKSQKNTNPQSKPAHSGCIYHANNTKDKERQPLKEIKAKKGRVKRQDPEKTVLQKIEEQTLKAFELSQKVQSPELKKIILAILNEARGSSQVKKDENSGEEEEQVPCYRFGSKEITDFQPREQASSHHSSLNYSRRKDYVHNQSGGSAKIEDSLREMQKVRRLQQFEPPVRYRPETSYQPGMNDTYKAVEAIKRRRSQHEPRYESRYQPPKCSPPKENRWKGQIGHQSNVGYKRGSNNYQNKPSVLERERLGYRKNNESIGSNGRKYDYMSSVNVLRGKV